MLAVRAVGRDAAALKYDLLTALGAYALAQPKGVQRLVLRLITLITARYNWARDELAVGQREIARLWAVDERTVKREMARLRGLGWLRVKRQGARGRVTEYALEIDAVRTATQPHWTAVGCDFAARMLGEHAPAQNVVPLPSTARIAPPDPGNGSEWSLARAILHTEGAACYGAWIAPLQREGRAGGRLTLRAPSRFHATYVTTHLQVRLLAACRAVDADVSEVCITA